MATRSIIARKTNGSWQGNYHHWDGYPSGVGRALYDLYRGHFEHDLSRMLEVLIDDHRGGWSSIVERDWNKELGYREMATRMAEADFEEAAPPECYCHGERNEGPYPYLVPDGDTMGANYLYIIDTEAKTMTISRHQYPAHTWTELTTVDLDGDEPDWENLG